MLKVGQVNPTRRFAFLRPRLGAPEAIVGEPLHQVAQSNLGTIFWGKPRQPMRAASRQAILTTTWW
jgi:hypothetical protein